MYVKEKEGGALLNMESASNYEVARSSTNVTRDQGGEA